MALKSQLTIESQFTTEKGPASDDDTPETEDAEFAHKSELAHEVSSLKDSINKVVKERNRLPQPLFWSLFNSKIKELREQKERSRRLEELLSKLE